MTIRKSLQTITMAIIMALALPFTSMAANDHATGDSTTDAALANMIVTRVNEINNMDKTNLTSSEKKELKKELLDLKEKAGGLDQRVYLSVGAIIIIILLLILIL